MQEMIPRMVTIAVAAQETGMTYSSILRLCLQNKIVFVKSGKKFLINFGKLVDYLNQGEGGEQSCTENPL